MRNFAKDKKSETLATSGLSFNKSAVLAQQVQKENKEKAEQTRTKGQLQKMQIINTEELCETLNKIKTMKANNAQFEEVDLPEDMENLTIKNRADERPINSKKEYKIEEEIEEYEELEEYYDDEFEDYVEEAPKLKSTATKEEF